MARTLSDHSYRGNRRAEAGLALTSALEDASTWGLSLGETAEYLINVLACLHHLPGEWITGLDRTCPFCRAEPYKPCVVPATEDEHEEFGATWTVCAPHPDRIKPRVTVERALRDHNGGGDD